MSRKNIALRSSQTFYIFILRVEIATIFEPKVVATHYNIFQPNFGILLLLKGSFWKFRFLLSRSKVSL